MRDEAAELPSLSSLLSSSSRISIAGPLSIVSLTVIVAEGVATCISFPSPGGDNAAYAWAKLGKR